MTQPTLKQWLARGKKEPKVRTRIKRRSTKRAKEERVYNTRVKVWLTLPENKWCGIWCAKKGVHWSAIDEDGKVLIPPKWVWARCPRATQCHHRAGRIGAKLLAEKDWIPASHDEHMWVHANASTAREIGVLI